MHNKDLFVLENIPESFSGKENLEYFRKYNSGESSAREELIIHNLKLVFYRVYKTYSTLPIDNEELISIGIIGLIKAVDTFDIDKNNQFTSYAFKCIDNEILYFLRGEKKHKRPISLDEYISLGNLKVGDFIYDEEDLVSNYEEKETLSEVRKLISSLPEEDKVLYNLYFNKGFSQKEISSILDMSESNISRRIKKILIKLENRMYLAGIMEKNSNNKIKKLRCYNKKST